MGNDKKPENSGKNAADDLAQNKPEVATKQAEAKKKASEMMEKGLSSASEAAEYMKLIGLKHSATHKGQPVTMLFATSDGQFFYGSAAAAHHNKVVGKKAIFEVKV